MRRNHLIALALAAVTLALYWPVRGFDLVYWDDPQVMTDCPEAQAGFTWVSLKWAVTGVVIANWHPVTNLSFLAVSQFFGASPGAQHLANALNHAANAGLLFWLLLRLTGATWRSAIVAAVFAWHPLRVESVAWIIERKDVLCAFFFFLTLLAWARWAKARGDAGYEMRDVGKKSLPASSIERHTSSYWLALIFFALALLSKPMAVTLPFVLLLLDVWPLRRFSILDFRFSILKPLLREKIPFFALMILFCVATYFIQRDYAAMTPWEKLGLAPRVQNAIAGYVAYLAQLFWPFDLAAIYPYPKSFDPILTGLKAALLLAISALCLAPLKKRPQLAVGWCWYLGTALPVIGMVQVGEQAMADRYTYLPLIGPVIALVWTAAEFFSRTRSWKIISAAATIFMLSALTILSARQIQFWRNTISLFAHNVEVTPENSSAHFTLGLGYEHAGETNRALICYRVAKKLEPRDFQNRRNLASLLGKSGQLSAAETEYRSLLADEPTHFQNHLGLAGLLGAQGRADESIAELNETLRLNSDATEALNNLAWALATDPRPEIRDGPRAVALAQHACELTQFSRTMFIGTLAAAQAETGKFDEAVATAQQACEVATKNGEKDLWQRNQELQERYRAHKTARE